jgi:hypothetical protein
MWCAIENGCIQIDTGFGERTNGLVEAIGPTKLIGATNP